MARKFEESFLLCPLIRQLTCDVFEVSHDENSQSHRRQKGRESLASGMLGVCAANVPLNSFVGLMVHLRCRAVFPACSKDR